MTTEWIPVGALGDAFLPDNNCLPQSADLDGRRLVLHFEEGRIITHTFMGSGQMEWAVTEGGISQNFSETCSITRPREGIYFIDFIKALEAATSVSLVLDLARGTFVGVIGKLPLEGEALTPLLSRVMQGKELTAVGAQFVRGTINRPFGLDATIPQPTRKLLGKRIEYTYSPQERYEHIYLNEQFYTWRCIAGSENGLADTDACRYYEIADGLYLFVWREKIIPTLGVVILDLVAMKTTGKIMGYEGNDFGTVRNFAVGAYVRELSTISAE